MKKRHLNGNIFQRAVACFSVLNILQTNLYYPHCILESAGALFYVQESTRFTFACIYGNLDPYLIFWALNIEHLWNVNSKKTRKDARVRFWIWKHSNSTPLESSRSLSVGTSLSLIQHSLKLVFASNYEHNERKPESKSVISLRLSSVTF